MLPKLGFMETGFVTGFGGTGCSYFVIFCWWLSLFFYDYFLRFFALSVFVFFQDDLAIGYKNG